MVQLPHTCAMCVSEGGLNVEEPIDFCNQSSLREGFLHQGRWQLVVLLTERGHEEQSGARRGHQLLCQLDAIHSGHDDIGYH
jgi:hypothetical protein